MRVIALDKMILGGGLIAIGATVFAESGLLLGFFLPGDTLLFGAGLLASQNVLPLGLLVFVVIVAAIVGDNVGYSIGRRTGKRLFNKKDSLLFKHEHLEKAEKFYQDHGGKTIILARFVPMVRTFAPMVAGIGKMSRGRFLLFNIIGGILWGGGVTILGFVLGSRIPWLADYVSHVLLLIIVASIALSFVHIFKDKKNRQILLAKIRLTISNIFLNKKID